MALDEWPGRGEDDALSRVSALVAAGEIWGAERALRRLRDLAADRQDRALMATAALGLDLCRLIAQFDEATIELDKAHERTLALRAVERATLSQSLSAVLSAGLPEESAFVRTATAVLHAASRLPFALGIVEVAAPLELRPGRRELRVRLLGGFEVSVDGAPVTNWRSARARQVFAYLALNWRQPVSRQRLMGLFWPEHSEERAENNLSLAMMAVRRILGAEQDAQGLIRASGGAYSLASVDVRLDVDEFLDLMARAAALEAAGSKEEAAEALDGAISLYGGEFLPGARYEDWTAERRQHLQDSYVEALSRRARLARGSGDYKTAIATGRRLLECDSANEDAHRDLMLDYLKTGQRYRALRQAQTCLQALKREVGVAPGRATLDVIQLISRRST